MNLHELAGAYKEAGKMPQAIHLYKELRDKLAAKFGPDHPRTLAALMNLAETQLGAEGAGKGAENILLFEQLRDRVSKKFGPDHPTTLTALHNLAAAYKYAGRLPEAIALYEQVRDKRTEHLGPDHPDTLITLSGLGETYRIVGKLTEAVRLFEWVRDKRTAQFGPDHPSTLRALLGLAATHRDGRKLPEAILLYKQVMEKRAIALGPDHPDTLSALCDLVVTYMDAGKLPEAISLYEQVRGKEIGNLPAAALTSLNNLAVVFWQRRRLDLSIPLFEKILAAREIKLGPNHELTWATAFNLAVNYRDDERLTDAAKVMDKWLPRVQANVGLDNPTRYYGVDTAVGIYGRTAPPAKAEPLLRELADHWKQKAGADSTQYAGELAAVGWNLLLQNKPAEAEPVLRDSLSIRVKKGPEVWTTFYTKSLLGSSLLGQKKYADAEPLLLQGYEGMKQRDARIPAGSKMRIIEALERLVKLYDAMGSKEKAADWRKNLASAKLVRGLWDDLFAGQEARHRFTETKHAGVLTVAKRKQPYPLEMKAGQTYVVDLESKAFDTFLILEAPDGSRLVENDDISPANLNSRIIFTAQKSGTYQVIATAFAAGATGAYVVRIRELVEEK